MNHYKYYTAIFQMNIENMPHAVKKDSRRTAAIFLVLLIFRYIKHEIVLAQQPIQALDTVRLFHSSSNIGSILVRPWVFWIPSHFV